MKYKKRNLGVPTKNEDGTLNLEYKRGYREARKQEIRDYERLYRREYRKQGRDNWVNKQKENL